MAATAADARAKGTPEGKGGAGKLLLGLLVVGALVAAFTLLPLTRWLLGTVEWVRGAGGTGAAVYVALYVTAAVLLLPGSVLTLAAGFLYGPLWGTLLVSPASVLAATLAFLLGRTTARGWVARKVEGNARFAAIDRAVGSQGLRIVLLLRLSPVLPFNLLNYALGLTRVRTRDYVLGSFIGMLPGTVLYVYLGSLVTSVSELLSPDRTRAGAFGSVLYWGGLVATVAAAVAVTVAARKALNSALADAQTQGGGGGGHAGS
jgi:uncharacterized membrane protein YdjX (TVP38/TMEM64 family)